MFEKLINQRYSGLKEISDSVDYGELVYETKSGNVIDFSVYGKPSDSLFFNKK